MTQQRSDVPRGVVGLIAGVVTGLALLVGAGCATPQQQQLALVLDSMKVQPSVAMVQLDPQGKEIKIGGRIEFQPAKAVLLASSHAVLDEVAGVLASNPQIALLEVQGHTDALGDDARNQALSQKRAEAVVAYLVGKGIAANRLVARGFGEQRPIDRNDTAAGRSRNRRVEFHIVGDKAVGGVG